MTWHRAIPCSSRVLHPVRAMIAIQAIKMIKNTILICRLPRQRTEAASAAMPIIRAAAQPAKTPCIGLRPRPGKLISTSAISSACHFEGANITATSSQYLRLTDSDRTIEALIPTFRCRRDHQQPAWDRQRRNGARKGAARGSDELGANVLAGVLILTYQPFRYGDRIMVVGLKGGVVHIDLRYTTIQDGDKRHLISRTR